MFYAQQVLDLNNMSLPLKLTGQRFGKTDRILNALVCMTGSEHVILAAAISDPDLINDVLDLGAIRANDTDENNTITNELLNQSVETRAVSSPAVQHYFLWVRHGEV